MGASESNRDPRPVGTRLGDEVRRLRTAAKLTQQGLADRVYYSRSYIALIETGREHPSAEAVERIAKALGNDGRTLRALHGTDNSLGRSQALVTFGVGNDTAVIVESRPVVGQPEHLLVGGSSVFKGALVALVPFDPAAQPCGLQRTLAIAARDGSLFALDALELSRRPRKTIPRAYRLDDFTYAVLSAVANLDDALLADDTSLREAQAAVVEYEKLNGSAVSREIVRELQEVSQMWLGSRFCVRHILRNTASFTDTPVFWTAENRGEEGANWLLFQHKFRYLQELKDRFGRTTRIFCIPEEAVSSSPRYERVLMFMAAALMESFDISVQATSDPNYQAVGGFVLSPDSRALVANWLRADGVWHVDNTTRQTVVREMKDVAGQGAAHSILDAPTSKARLQALAAYLNLDWGWLVARASELSSEGISPFVSPRSRLLSLSGIEAACAHLQGFAHLPLPHDLKGAVT